jgi:hypothetical protein
VKSDIFLILSSLPGNFFFPPQLPPPQQFYKEGSKSKSEEKGVWLTFVSNLAVHVA